MVGYQGCIDTDAVNVNVMANNTHISNVDDSEIEAFNIAANGDWTPNRPAELSFARTPVPLSDVLFIHYAATTSTAVTCPGVGTSSCNSQTGAINIAANTAGIAQNDLVIVTNCESAELIRVSNTPGQGATTLQYDITHNTSATLANTYSDDSQVLQMNGYAFYVADTGRNNSRGDDIFGLYRFDVFSGAEEELVEGVEMLRIQYGQQLDSGNMRFVDRTDGNLDMSEVVALRMSLLVASTPRVLSVSDTSIYNLAGSNVIPASASAAGPTYPDDQRMRKSFMTTVMLRNRMD